MGRDTEQDSLNSEPIKTELAKAAKILGIDINAGPGAPPAADASPELRITVFGDTPQSYEQQAQRGFEGAVVLANVLIHLAYAKDDHAARLRAAHTKIGEHKSQIAWLANENIERKSKNEWLEGELDRMATKAWYRAVLLGLVSIPVIVEFCWRVLLAALHLGAWMVS